MEILKTTEGDTFSRYIKKYERLNNIKFINFRDKLRDFKPELNSRYIIYIISDQICKSGNL